jgi:cysteine desulfuration protein SufE
MHPEQFPSCLEKQRQLIILFSSCASLEAKYEQIIELGKSLPAFDESHKKAENIVQGCQSLLYLHSELQDYTIYFKISSEALISAGLGALLLAVYNGESPEAVLTCPPDFIKEIDLHASLTPGRSNGLASMYLRMKQDALKLLMIPFAENKGTFERVKAPNFNDRK